MATNIREEDDSLDDNIVEARLELVRMRLLVARMRHQFITIAAVGVLILSGCVGAILYAISSHYNASSGMNDTNIGITILIAAVVAIATVHQAGGILSALRTLMAELREQIGIVARAVEKAIVVRDAHTE